MKPDLETLICADEEARARVDAAREDARRRLEAARSERDRHLEERRAHAEAMLVGEVGAIRAEGEKLVQERRRRREELLRMQRAEADGRLERATQAYEQILRDGPPRGAT